MKKRGDSTLPTEAAGMMTSLSFNLEKVPLHFDCLFDIWMRTSPPIWQMFCNISIDFSNATYKWEPVPQCGKGIHNISIEEHQFLSHLLLRHSVKNISETLVFGMISPSADTDTLLWLVSLEWSHLQVTLQVRLAPKFRSAIIFGSSQSSGQIIHNMMV